jgi:OOP family OmpA-OmpF porin
MSPIGNTGGGHRLSQLKTGPKLVLAALAVALGVFGLRTAAEHGWIPTPGILKALVPSKAELPSLQDAKVENVQPVAFPTSSLSKVEANPVLADIWEWNAAQGFIFANGGAHTTKGSLMEKYGVNLTISRQDSNDQMKADLVACAKQIHDGDKFCTSGANFIVVMGDGAGQWAADLNPELSKFGPEYKLGLIGAVGYSRGEDAFLGPAEWKKHPAAAKGGTTVGVLRDGDWNIALKWLGDNGIKNNPDEKTYDPDALNWIAAPDNDYIKAVTEVFNVNRCEDRKVVKDGKLTGQVKNVCPDAVVTWTPGDEKAVNGRGGVVKIVSSKEYRSQMPSVILGPRKFFNDNREEVQGLLAATFEAGNQLKAFDDAVKKASELSAKVYDDQDGKYWYKYFKGVTEKGVPLGGSAVNNLEDNLILFGLKEGSNNNMRATYTVFANIVSQQYPDLYGAKHPVPSYKEVADTSFVLGAKELLESGGVTSAKAEDVDYSQQAESGNVVSKAAYQINFATGSAEPLPDGVALLNRLKDSLAITGLAIKVDGYTDNTGSEPINRSLSAARARAVEQFLNHAAPSSFPSNRFQTAGHGSQNPVASNLTAAGKAQNRRVEITLLGE